MTDKKPVESLDEVNATDDLGWQQQQLRKKAELTQVLDERAMKDKGLRGIAEERNREMNERDENQGYTGQ